MILMIIAYKKQFSTLMFVQVCMTIELDSYSTINILALKHHALNEEHIWYSIQVDDKTLLVNKKSKF